MDLLEYQAKELFREVGIPVLPSQRIDHPRDLKRLEIPYPVVLKSQVPTGGRGRAGGIRFVENTIDAIAAARAVFNLSILGQYPQVLLAESRYDAEQEFFLAVILDYALGRPVLLGSSQGGINVEAVIEKMQRVVVEQEFSPFYARRLALKMGLQGNLIEVVSGIIQKMYQLFVQKDLDLIEINPLAISSTGEAMALDGKISANDYAIGRHGELATLGTMTRNRKDQPQTKSQLTELNWTDTEGNIGILCNSTCLAATTLDLIYQAKGKPASCLIVDGYASWDVQTSASGVQQLQEALQQIASTEGIKVVLVNILSSTEASEEVAEAIATYLLARVGETAMLNGVEWVEKPTITSHLPQRLNRTGTLERSSASLTGFPQFVIRLVGEKLDFTKEGWAAIPVHWIEDLDEAVACAISLSKSQA
ncbi:Succinyl-CoA ligase [ADP-forming] beta chain [uncultured Coleofasciculus sp.]|uniref:Succinyl-CoA ligase [ADP-forming] beta chain n=1 Tax=uncultured Coleofasciculus sp. TaxID=1267456 RepID=A0A6J4K3Q4_9CYAN|nr:Succinyl-CoA ligase [ADP-forming] beta chain [uncultured Coleofasciculus sp.]